MSFKTDMIELVVISAVVVLLSVIGLVWDIASRLLLSGIDGIMLAAMCLMMGAVFSFELYVELKRAGLLPPIKLYHRKTTESVAAPASSTAAEKQSK